MGAMIESLARIGWTLAEALEAEDDLDPLRDEDPRGGPRAGRHDRGWEVIMNVHDGGSGFR